MQFSCFPVLLGSAEAQVLRGGTAKRVLIIFICNIVPKMSKSVHMCQSYSKPKVGRFWECVRTPCPRLLRTGVTVNARVERSGSHCQAKPGASTKNGSDRRESIVHFGPFAKRRWRLHRVKTAVWLWLGGNFCCIVARQRRDAWRRQTQWRTRGTVDSFCVQRIPSLLSSFLNLNFSIQWRSTRRSPEPWKFWQLCVEK